VTGAPGLLGSRLVEALCGGIETNSSKLAASQVVALVGPGRDPRLVEMLGARPVLADLTRPNSLDGALDGIDIVFHAAGLVHPKLRTADLFSINTLGTQALIDRSVQAGVKRFVFVSSNSAAGTNVRRSRLMKETDPSKPYMKYGKSKAQAEEIINDYARRGLIESVILRPCWYYGPGESERQTRLFRMIKAGNPIVFGDGHNYRSMSYIDNVVQGLMLAAVCDNVNGHTFWLADQRPYKIIEIYKTVAELLGVKTFRPRYVPGLLSTVIRTADGMLQSLGFYQTEVHVAGELDQDIACSINKAHEKLGYQPSVDLKEGMRRSIEWCRRNGINI